MNRLEAWLVQGAGSPLTFVLIVVVLAVGVVVIFLPSESLVVAVAALLLARPDRDVRLPLLVLSAALGLAAGDVILYVFVRSLSRRLQASGRSSAVLASLRRRLDKRATDIRTRFTGHPWSTMIFMRLVPVGRAASDVVAADLAVPLRRFIAYACAGGLVYGVYCVAVAALAYPLVQRYPLASMIGVIVVAVVLSSVVDRLDRGLEEVRAGRRNRTRKKAENS